MEIESVPEESDIEILKKHTELIHKYTEETNDLIPLLNSLEDQVSQIKLSLSITKGVIEIYDLVHTRRLT